MTTVYRVRFYVRTNFLSTNRCVSECEAVAVLVWTVRSHFDEGVSAIHGLDRRQDFAHAIGRRHERTLSQTLLQLFGIYLWEAEIPSHIPVGLACLCPWQ